MLYVIELFSNQPSKSRTIGSGYISQGYVHRPQLDWDVLDQVLRIRTTTSKRIGIQMAVLRYLAGLAGITS